MSSGYQLNVTANASTLDSSIKSVTTKNTYKITVEADGSKTKKLISSLTTTQDTTGKVTKEFTKLNQTTGKWSTTLTESSKKVNSSLKQVDSSTKNVNSSLKSTESVSKKVGQSFLDIIKKVAKFRLATIPIQMFQKTLRETIEIIKNFDSAITEMSKVSSYSREALRKYTQDLGDLGEEVGRTTTAMTEMATGWLKAGYSEEDSAKLSKYSALLQNTADEELSASEATSILVSQLKAYNMDADEAITVTDILNKVSAEEAVSSGDLAKGLTQASASMSTFGNDIYETTALLTAGTTVFQNKSQQVARG